MTVNRTGVALLLAALLGVLASCSESVEMRLDKAQVALDAGRSDVALELAESVLAEQPDNVAAARIKGMAMIGVLRIDAARWFIEAQVNKHPEDRQLRLDMVLWSRARARQLLNQSDFSRNDSLLAQFDEALRVGQAHAEALEKGKATATDGRFARAQLAEFDAERLRRQLRTAERSLDNHALDPQLRAKAEAERQQISDALEARLNEIAWHLRAVLEAEPNRFEACEMSADLLTERRHWNELVTLAERLGSTTDVPATTAERVVTALLAAPESVMPIAQRIALAWKVQGNVANTDRAGRVWRVTTVRLHHAGGEHSKARPILEELLSREADDLYLRFLEGQNLYGLKQYDRATRVLEKLLADAPNSAQINTLFGLVMLKTGKPHVAREHLRLATELDPRDPVARESFLSLLAQTGNIREAEYDIDEYVRRRPNDARAMRVAMAFEIARGRKLEIARLLERAQAVSPLSEDHLKLLIDGYTYLRDHDRAFQFARELTVRHPDEAENHHRFVEVLLRRGEVAEARQVTLSIAAKFPGEDADLTFARLCLRADRTGAAMSVLPALVERRPDDPAARLLLAQALAGRGAVDEAVAQVQRVLEMDPSNLRAVELGARVLTMTGRAEQAGKLLARVDPAAMDEAAFPALAAQLYVQEGRFEQAMEVCNKAIVAGNQDPLLRVMLANLYRAAKNNSMAEMHLIALAELAPNNPDAYSLLTRFYTELNDVERGMSTLDRLGPESNPLVRIAQASLLLSTGQSEAAMLKLEPALPMLIAERNPLALAVADTLARIRAGAGQLSAAQDVYTPLIQAGLRATEAKLRQIDLLRDTLPTDELAQRLRDVSAEFTDGDAAMMGQVVERFLAMDRPAEALSLLQGWIVKFPQTPVLWQWESQVLLGMGRAQDAAAVLRDAVSRRPDMAEFHLLLGAALRQARDYPAALAAYEVLAKLPGAQDRALEETAQMYNEVGLTRSAAEAYRSRLASQQPRDAALNTAIARTLLAAGDAETARQCLEQVPRTTPQYVPAQVTLATIEHARGLTDQARIRVERLAEDSRTFVPVFDYVLSLDRQAAGDTPLRRWLDTDKLDVKTLPAATQAAWLRGKLRQQADTGDWPQAAQTLARLSELDSTRPSHVMARIAVVSYIESPELGRRLFNSVPHLASEPLGPLLSEVFNQKPESQAARQGLTALLRFALAGQADDARSVAASTVSRGAVFRDDLLATLEQMPPGQATAPLYRQLALAHIAAECGLPQLSAQLCEQVIKRSPAAPLAHAMRVDALAALGQPLTDALAMMRQQAPDAAVTLWASAVDAMRSHKPDFAAEQLQRLLAREPQGTHVAFALSQALQAGGHADRAISVLEPLARAPGPFQTLASNDLAYQLAKHQPARLTEARQLAQAALDEAPINPAVLDTLGWVMHLQGEHRPALDMLVQAVRQLPAFQAVHYRLGAVYDALGHRDWARHHLTLAATGPADAPETGLAKKLLESLPKQ